MRPRPLQIFGYGMLVALTASAQTGPDAPRCASAYEQTQMLRRGGKLVAARASAVQCSAAACPQVLAKDCGRWVAEIEPAIPRVVLSAKDASGATLEAVVIHLDGNRLPSSGGQSIEVDPGEHVLRFEHPAAKPIERRELFVEGEKNHRVSVTFGDIGLPTQSDVPRHSTGRRIQPAAWVAAGVSVLAFATSAVFGVRALQKRAELERSGCKPRCNPNQVVALQREAAYADIAAGAGVVAAGGAVYLFLSSPDDIASAPQRPKQTVRLLYRAQF